MIQDDGRQTVLGRNLSTSESRSLWRSHLATSLLDHDITLCTAAVAAAVGAVADGEVSTDPLCDAITHCGDVVTLPSLPPTDTHDTVASCPCIQ